MAPALLPGGTECKAPLTSFFFSLCRHRHVVPTGGAVPSGRGAHSSLPPVPAAEHLGHHTHSAADMAGAAGGSRHGSHHAGGGHHGAHGGHHRSAGGGGGGGGGHRHQQGKQWQRAGTVVRTIRTLKKKGGKRVVVAETTSGGPAAGGGDSDMQRVASSPADIATGARCSGPAANQCCFLSSCLPVARPAQLPPACCAPSQSTPTRPARRARRAAAPATTTAAATPRFSRRCGAAGRASLEAELSGGGGATHPACSALRSAGAPQCQAQDGQEPSPPRPTLPWPPARRSLRTRWGRRWTRTRWAGRGGWGGGLGGWAPVLQSEGRAVSSRLSAAAGSPSPRAKARPPPPAPAASPPPDRGLRGPAGELLHPGARRGAHRRRSPLPAAAGAGATAAAAASTRHGSHRRGATAAAVVLECWLDPRACRVLAAPARPHQAHTPSPLLAQIDYLLRRLLAVNERIDDTEDLVGGRVGGGGGSPGGLVGGVPCRACGGTVSPAPSHPPASRANHARAGRNQDGPQAVRVRWRAMDGWLGSGARWLTANRLPAVGRGSFGLAGGVGGCSTVHPPTNPTLPCPASNELVATDLMVTTVTAGFAFVAMIAGIYGMNLVGGWGAWEGGGVWGRHLLPACRRSVSGPRTAPPPPHCRWHPCTCHPAAIIPATSAATGPRRRSTPTPTRTNI